VAGSDGDDDLPRTLRREREAQARRAREQDESRRAREQDESRRAGGPEHVSPSTSSAPDIAPPPFEPDHYEFDELEPAPATVTRLDVPFLHLMMFFLKAVVAGIPALFLLLAILWGIGEMITATFPDLIKMQILIRMPN
jgi:hypothetical protein